MTLNYNKTLEIKYNTDVLVLGGGPSGVAAAVAAARNGAKVLLIEKQGALGGLGTLGLVPLFMGFDDSVNFYAGGIGKEILNSMHNKMSGQKDHFGNYIIDPESLKLAYDEIVEKEENLEILFFTEAIDVIQENDEVKAVILSSKSGVYAASAKTYIDCTGCGSLITKTTAKCTLGDKDGNVMGSTLCTLWGNVDWENAQYGEDEFLEKAYNDGVFTTLDLHLPGMVRHGKAGAGGNLGHIYNVNENDEEVLTKAIIKGRKLAKEYENYYRGYVKGYENAELMATASILGVREGVRVEGDYRLNVNDFITKATFKDEIGRLHYAVDLHAATSSKKDFDKYHEEFNEKFVYEDGDSYGIPLSCLIPKTLKNVFIAGRLLSADREMLATLRVMPGCFITGQAVGVAAAISSGDIRKIDIKELQKRLKNMGAFLPNTD